MILLALNHRKDVQVQQDLHSWIDNSSTNVFQSENGSETKLYYVQIRHHTTRELRTL